MKLTEFMVVIVAALLFLIPNMKQEQRALERQEQEEVPMEEMLVLPNTYRITYESKSPEEEPIVDIIWMKKAAEVSKEAGIPYFNVLEQKVSKQGKLSVIEGVIELDADPMRAEFDAQEIESLILTDIPQ